MSGPPAGARLLELADVSAAYGPYRALFSVSFSVPEGAAVALLGPNGAGKSTVARVVSGLVVPTAGQVRLGGVDVAGWPSWRIARAGLAHVPEGRAVFGGLSVEENLTLSLRGRVGARGVGSALARVYERWPVLGERRHQRAGALSGGQQRLLSLAKVLVAPPRVVVADELSLGLAPSVVDTVYEALAELVAAGTALVLVEQQVHRALSLAGEAVVLEHGTVAYAGPAAGALGALEQVLTGRGERTSVLAGAFPGGGRTGRRRGRLRAGRARRGHGDAGTDADEGVAPDADAGADVGGDAGAGAG